MDSDLYPGPFLPPTVIVKKLKPTWDEEFHDEKKTYGKLKILQGHVIPVLYGEVKCDGTCALVLSDVGGIPLCADEAEGFSEQHLRAMLKSALRPILELGVEPADTNLSNYHIVGDRIFILDFEDTAEVDPGRVDLLADELPRSLVHWYNYYHQHKPRPESFSNQTPIIRPPGMPRA